MNAAAKAWPDTRYPDNTKIDKEIREQYFFDPVDKKPVADNVAHAHYGDWGDRLNGYLESDKYKVFVRSQALTFAPGESRAVSQALANCTANDSRIELAWEQSVTTSTSFTLTVGAQESFFSFINFSMEMSFSLGWEWSKTFSDTYEMTISPRHLGWMERAPLMQTVTGEIFACAKGEGSVKSVVVWAPGQITGMATDGRPAGVLSAKERPLNSQEQQDFCTMRKDGKHPDTPMVAEPLMIPLLDGTTTTRIG